LLVRSMRYKRRQRSCWPKTSELTRWGSSSYFFAGSFVKDRPSTTRRKGLSSRHFGKFIRMMMCLTFFSLLHSKNHQSQQLMRLSPGELRANNSRLCWLILKTWTIASSSNLLTCSWDCVMRGGLQLLCEKFIRSQILVEVKTRHSPL